MMHVDARLTLWAALTLMSSLLMPAEAISADDEVMFEKEIRPLFVQTCFKCHGGDSTSAGLRIDSLAALLAGGDSGPAIIPGDSAGSLLIQAVRRHEDVSAMPRIGRCPHPKSSIWRVGSTKALFGLARQWMSRFHIRDIGPFSR